MERLTKTWKYVSAHALPLTAVLLVLIVAYLVLISTGALTLPLPGTDNAKHKTPFEFLYLDNQRVDSYLGQLAEGNIETETRTDIQTQSAGLAFQTDAIGTATASTQDQRTKSAVVTLTQADNFYRLLHTLHDEGSIRTTSADAPRLVRELTQSHGGTEQSDGMMVSISDAFLQLPPYLSAYYELRYASFTDPDPEVFGSPPLTHFGLAQDTAGTEVASERRAFRTAVGENPRLPFIFRTHGLTIVMPARFVNLTGDPSLLQARLTVVGKVVAVDPKGFGDAASEFAYAPGLLGASPSFLRDIGVNGRVLQLPKQARKGMLFRALERSLTYPGPVVEIVPVAIYS
jgi:hypothetical protein